MGFETTEEYGAPDIAGCVISPGTTANVFVFHSARSTRLGLRVPRKVIDSNEIDWFITEQDSSQCNVLEALEPA